MRHFPTEDAPKSTVPFSQHYTSPYRKPVKTQIIEVNKGHDKFGQHQRLVVAADLIRAGYGIKTVETLICNEVPAKRSQHFNATHCNIISVARLVTLSRHVGCVGYQV